MTAFGTDGKVKIGGTTNAIDPVPSGVPGIRKIGPMLGLTNDCRLSFGRLMLTIRAVIGSVMSGPASREADPVPISEPGGHSPSNQLPSQVTKEPVFRTIPDGNVTVIPTVAFGRLSSALRSAVVIVAPVGCP